MTMLKGKKREIKESLDTLRANGSLPAVYYGAGKDSTPISVDSRDFEKVYDEVGESHTFSLDIDGTKVDVLVHQVDRHPVSNMPIHVDFLVVDTNKPVEVAIPLEYVGASEAERAGGIITKTLHEVEVSALPSKIPDTIQVDISLLVDSESVITLGDLVLPSGVSLTGDADMVVASVTAQKEEEDQVVSAEDALAKIEVKKKGKKEEEEA